MLGPLVFTFLIFKKFLSGLFHVTLATPPPHPDPFLYGEVVTRGMKL